MAERKSFLLRIDNALFEDVKRWADAELRSVNGQIEFILRRAVDQRRPRSGNPTDQPTDNPSDDTAPAE